MGATSADIAGRLSDVIHSVDGAESLPRADQQHILDELEAFECWQPAFRLLNRIISQADLRQPADYIRKASILYRYLNDLPKAAETCAQLFKDCGSDFKSFSQQALREFLADDDFAAEAQILQTIQPQLKTEQDRVHCLERLCVLYEKKIFDEKALSQSFEKLLKLDPKNQRALRYFKIVFTQNNEWEEVARVLRTLLDSAAYPADRSRLALELASVYLYQLDSANLAVNLIEEHCEDSGLDTSTVKYDAYFRLRDWEGCLKILRQSLEKIDAAFTQAVLYLKIGEWEEKLGRSEEAAASFAEAHRLAPKFLEPMEKLIETHLEAKNWTEVMHYLDQLAQAVHDPEAIERLKEARNRIKNGLEHAR